ncbi:MAG: hypothetical protein QF441_02750 [Bacteriovoracaceae bacterium]|jgi:hypothetical protein|nr:hypothetical protein [Halobacteriovoraceae bacterium]MDP7319494.1 hypothetical protein [Bacteriovoracaceae bacterium]
MHLFKALSLICLIFLLPEAYAQKLETHKTAFLEYQTQGFSPQERAIENGQEDSTTTAHYIYSSFGFDIKLWSHKIEANGFIRHLEAKDIQNNPSLFYLTSPKNIIARDVFQMRHKDEGQNNYTEATLNHFLYEWGDDEVSFKAGRLFINYGHGYTINPINPFGFANGLSSTLGVQQGNDGVQIRFSKFKKLKISLYFLGDKSYTDYNNKITRTVFLRGQWTPNHTTKINYVFGEDQKRHKYGFELKHSLSYGLSYLQLMRHSQNLENQDAGSEGLFHYLLGHESDINQTWTTRIELAQLQKDEKTPEKINITYLPFEKSITWLNQFRFNDKTNFEIGISQDPSSTASLLKLTARHNFSKSLQGRIFAFEILNEAQKKAEYSSQYSIPNILGLGLRLEI